DGEAKRGVTDAGNCGHEPLLARSARRQQEVEIGLAVLGVSIHGRAGSNVVRHLEELARYRVGCGDLRRIDHVAPGSGWGERMVWVGKRDKQEKVLAAAVGQEGTGTVRDPTVVVEVLRHRAFPNLVEIRGQLRESTLRSIEFDGTRVGRLEPACIV